MKKSIKKNAVLNTIRTLMGIVFPMITFPYVSRVLSVEEIGIYDFSHSISNYFLLIGGLGLTTYAVREGARHRDSYDEMSDFASELYTISIYATMVAYILLIISVFGVGRLFPYRKEILIFSLQILLVTAGVVWIFNIYEEYAFITVRSVVFQCLGIVLMFVFVRQTGDVDKYILITVFANAGAYIVNLFRIKRFCKLSFVRNIKRIFPHLKPVLIIFMTSVTIVIYVNSDITMLGLMTNDYWCGIYGFSSKIYAIFKNVLVAILTVSLPRLSVYAASERTGEFWDLFEKMKGALLLVMLPAITGMLCISEDVVLLIGGEKYRASANSLRILSVAAFFSLFAYLYTQCFLVPYGKEGIVFRITILSAVTNILLNLIFIPAFREIATAVTTLIAEALVFGCAFYFARKNLVFEWLKKDMVPCVLGCVGIAVVCAAIRFSVDGYVLRIVLSMGFGVFVYAVALIAGRNTLVISVIRAAKMRSRSV